MADVTAIIDGSQLSDGAKRRALAIFTALAEEDQIAGLRLDNTESVVRGDLNSGRFAVFHLDSSNAVRAVEAALADGDPAWVHRAMSRLLAEVREQGTLLDDDLLIDSDVILPEADTAPEQLREWIGDSHGAGGLLP
mgnify:CR=1 FL=1